MTERQPPIDVSIIVVNYRTPQTTEAAVQAACRSAPGLSIEEIVVDNGSADDSSEYLAAARPSATLLELPNNRGFAAGVNAGIGVSRGRHLLLLNSDAFPIDSAVTDLVTYLDRHPSVGVVAPLLQFEDGRLQNSAYRRFPNAITVFTDYCLPIEMLVRGGPFDPHVVPPARLGTTRRIAHAGGATLLVRRRTVDRVGPLDDGFFLYLEETEWQRRMAANGWEIHLNPDARVTHWGGGSSEGETVLANPHYVASVRRYFHESRAVRAAMIAGAAISVGVLRLRQFRNRRDPDLARALNTYRGVLRAVWRPRVPN